MILHVFPNNSFQGYFERSDVVKLNALLLGSLKASWCNGLGNFDLNKLQLDVKRDFNHRANRILREVSLIFEILVKYVQLEGSGNAWQLKDPRMCLTFPLWRELIPAPVVIIAYRHPMEVANSLYR
jgi:hypothetical protein